MRTKKQTVSSEPLRKLLEHVSTTPKEIAAELDIHPSTIRSALNSGQMTKIMAVAIEGLRRRLGDSDTNQILVVAGPASAIALIENIAGPLDCSTTRLNS